MIPVVVVFVLMVDSMPWLAWLILVTFVVFYIVTVIRHNRCPHCEKMIDLRSRQVVYCPRCGKKITEVERGDTAKSMADGEEGT